LDLFLPDLALIDQFIRHDPLCFREHLLQVKEIHCMRFQMNPTVMSMKHEKEFNSRSSTIEGTKPYERCSGPPTHPIYGEGLPFQWEDIQQTGLTLYREQKWESALPWLEAAYFHYPECSDTSFLLSLVQARLGLIHESRSTATTLEDAGPSCTKTSLQLCWLSLETREWQSGREHLNMINGPSLHPILKWAIQVMAAIQSLRFAQAFERCQQAIEETDTAAKEFGIVAGLLKTQRYDTAATRLAELFTHQLNIEIFTETKTPSPPQDQPSLNLMEALPPLESISPSMDHLKHDKKLNQIRMESDFRKRFWIRERIQLRDDTPPMVLRELPSASRPMAASPSIPLPVPLIPTLPDASKHSTKVPQPATPNSGRDPFCPYSWLSIRQPWQDEQARLERWITASMRNKKGDSSFWTLTASHPERIVGLGCLTPKGNREGDISVSVNPLVAHHRQETSLFITLMQKAKQMRLTRLTANVEQDSLEDHLIRRNGFRIVHEEETLEIPLCHWKQQRNRPAPGTFLCSGIITRAFVEEDWPQIMELLQTPHSSTTPSTVQWDFPNETMMVPSTFNPQLSTVIKHQDSIIGALLVKTMPNKCLHVLLRANESHSPVDENTLIKSLLKRFLTLASKREFLTVRFKRSIDRQHIRNQTANFWKNKETVLKRTRTLAREEINP